MFRNTVVVRVTAALLMAAAIVSLVVLQLEFSSLKEQRANLESSIADLNDQVDRLEKKLSSAPDDRYVIGIAKDKLNLRLPGEVIFYNDLTH